MAQQAPEGWITKEGAGGEGTLWSIGDNARVWARRYAKISGPSLLFYRDRDDEEPRGVSIPDVRGCTLVRGTTTANWALGIPDGEYKIELKRSGLAAQGLPDLRGIDHTTRFCFPQEATRDRWADALQNMCAGRAWDAPADSAPADDGTVKDWRGIQLPAEARSPPRIAQIFTLTATAQGFGMRLSTEGVVIGFTEGGPAEPAGVPEGGRVVQVNDVPERSLQGITA